MTCRVGFQNNYGALCVVSALLQAVAIARWAGAEREPNFAGVGGVGGGGSEGSWSSSGGGSRTSTSSQGSRKLGPLMRDMHTFFENLRFFQGFLLDEMLEMHAGEVRDVTHANGYSAMEWDVTNAIGFGAMVATHSHATNGNQQ
ncbi:hypothetical protein T484DRAFT_1776167 [Baffinella frigidus]|nr:hypothetical protein T484DRAFT_1776167 [Cryptophyta sp. CCMP2293]